MSLAKTPACSVIPRPERHCDILAFVAKEGPVDEEDAISPGRELGRYHIVRLIGRGGMGAVYEALHRDLKKRVAIKTLHPAVAAKPAARARFLREGEAASRIRHPNIVDVTDVATEDGIPYLVMELLEGEDLAARLARSPGPSFSESADIMLPVFAAISVAHDEGVIHRDLKPANIFLTRTRRGGFEPKVLDFGISKLRSRSGGDTLALTGSDASMGTPYYIAPEQVRSAAGVDARSDQYALGAILYECVTGQRAHRGENIYEVIRSVGEGSFPPPAAIRADIPSELEAAILRAMQLEPARCPGTALAVDASGEHHLRQQRCATQALSAGAPGLALGWLRRARGSRRCRLRAHLADKTAAKRTPARGRGGSRPTPNIGRYQAARALPGRGDRQPSRGAIRSRRRTRGDRTNRRAAPLRRRGAYAVGHGARVSPGQAHIP
jgi:serine/threonine protein kinase